MEAQGDHVKVVIVGEKEVGKTCLLHAFVFQETPHEYTPTIFDNYSVKNHSSLCVQNGSQKYSILYPMQK